jgi:hypothetical protein
VTPTLYRSLGDKALLDVLPAEVRSYLEAVHALNGDRNRGSPTSWSRSWRC